MKTRVTNPRQPNFHHYGGRGITICDRWLYCFENFLADMGQCPEAHSLDRIDHNGNYEPGNCRWASWTQQQNNKRSNHVIEFGGQTKTLMEWARCLGVRRELIQSRLAMGWSVDDALNKPAKKTSRLGRVRLITHGGETLSLTEWAKRSNLKRETIAARLRLGWSTTDAIGLVADIKRKYAGLVEKVYDKL